MNNSLVNLVAVALQRAMDHPEKTAFNFLKDGEEDLESISYAVLDKRAQSLAARLQSVSKIGDRALLLISPGLDFIVTFFACLYARIIAIPLYAPHPARLENSIIFTLRVLEDATPSIVLLNQSLLDAIKKKQEISEKFRKIKSFIAVEEDQKDWIGKWKQPIITADNIAFLQYTSGSTSSPKGVMVTHKNLYFNLNLIEKSFGQTNQSQVLIWLPPNHDMGLIGGILQPFFTGSTSTLMSPLFFLQKPVRWLNLISKLKITTSGGPNFAYELCLKKVKPEQRDKLDLSTWEVAFNGAEPISKNTMVRFAEFFGPCGFKKEALLPCYGLAEATLLVSGGPKNRGLRFKNLEKTSLDNHEIKFSEKSNEGTKEVVSCGKIGEGIDVKIVDPKSLEECTNQKIGEIWISSQGVAKGYWNNPTVSDSTFRSYLSNNGDGPFLRTGDLGFISESELYVVGRLKNLIIIDGKNHYPHDIESIIESSHPAVFPGGSAVFSIDENGKEKVIAVAEIQHRMLDSLEELKKAVRNSVGKNYDLPIADIIITSPGQIPRTTSGKIKHFECRKKYLTGKLKEISAL